MENNKVFEFINKIKLENKNPNFYYPHPEDPDRADNSKEKKTIEEIETYKRISLEAKMEFQTFCNLIREEVNNLKNIKAVVYGRRDSGNTYLPFKNIILIMTDNKIHYYEQNKTNFSLGLFVNLISTSKAMAKPYKYKEFDLSGEMSLIGRPYQEPWFVKILENEKFMIVYGVDSFLWDHWNEEIGKIIFAEFLINNYMSENEKINNSKINVQSIINSNKLDNIKKVQELYKNNKISKEVFDIEFENEVKKFLIELND